MEASTLPKDVLALGSYLVDELGFADGVDTLGRWMSHYLAELIDKAENGSAQEQKEASAVAVDTILKVWEHRASFPGNAYPLTPFKDIIGILDVLRPDASPWEMNRLNGFNSIAADIYSYLCRITVGLLAENLTQLGNNKEKQLPAGILSVEEQRLVEALNIFTQAQLARATQLGEHGMGEEPENIAVAHQLLPLIDGLAEKLGELRTELIRQKEDRPEHD